MTDLTNSTEAHSDGTLSQQSLLELGIPFSSIISGTYSNQIIESKEMNRKNWIEITSCQCT